MSYIFGTSTLSRFLVTLDSFKPLQVYSKRLCTSSVEFQEISSRFRVIQISQSVYSRKNVGSTSSNFDRICVDFMKKAVKFNLKIFEQITESDPIESP